MKSRGEVCVWGWNMGERCVYGGEALGGGVYGDGAVGVRCVYGQGTRG